MVLKVRRAKAPQKPIRQIEARAMAEYVRAEAVTFAAIQHLLTTSDPHLDQYELAGMFLSTGDDHQKDLEPLGLPAGEKEPSQNTEDEKALLKSACVEAFERAVRWGLRVVKTEEEARHWAETEPLYLKAKERLDSFSS